jgi:hypothetical protein
MQKIARIASILKVAASGSSRRCIERVAGVGGARGSAAKPMGRKTSWLFFDDWNIASIQAF